MSAVTDALGQTASVGYDANGRTTAAIRKNGGVLATAYDAAGRITAETDALGQEAALEYDALGNIVKITAPGNAVTLYAYDAAGS